VGVDALGAEWQNAAAHTGDELRRLWQTRCEASRGSWQRSWPPVTPRSARRIRPGTVKGSSSLRWVLVHMIEEYAATTGHADLLRESIDGETGE
jgi:hypothetical protein